MARKYSKSAGKDVKRAVHRKKKGKLKSGKGGKGGTVKSRKQAIAIGLSEARKKGKKVPKKKSSAPDKRALSGFAPSFPAKTRNIGPGGAFPEQPLIQMEQP